MHEIACPISQRNDVLLWLKSCGGEVVVNDRTPRQYHAPRPADSAGRSSAGHSPARGALRAHDGLRGKCCGWFTFQKYGFSSHNAVQFYPNDNALKKRKGVFEF